MDKTKGEKIANNTGIAEYQSGGRRGISHTCEETERREIINEIIQEHFQN